MQAQSALLKRAFAGVDLLLSVTVTVFGDYMANLYTIELIPRANIDAMSTSTPQLTVVYHI